MGTVKSPPDNSNMMKSLHVNKSMLPRGFISSDETPERPSLSRSRDAGAAKKQCGTEFKLRWIDFAGKTTMGFCRHRHVEPSLYFHGRRMGGYFPVVTTDLLLRASAHEREFRGRPNLLHPLPTVKSSA